MTFEEFIGDRVNVLSPQEYHAVEDVWNYQQERIKIKNDMIMSLEDSLKKSQERTNVLETLTDNQQLTIADQAESEDEYLERIKELEEQLTSAKLVNAGLHTRLKNLQDKLDEIEPVEECLFDTQEEHDRYELEQAIMSCWGITDDLQLIAKQYAGGDESLITSVSNLYDLKFRNLFEQFEKFTGCY